MIEEDAINVAIEKPYLVVVEAKRTEAIETSDSNAQLLAQIKSLSLQW
jgi:hypothetical protein